jgi:predicted nucleic acid-binding protein
MTMYLLDTNIVSEIRKSPARRDAGVAAWADDLDPANAALSAITVSELATWVARTERKDIAQGALLRRWFTEAILGSAHILPVDTEVGVVAGELHVPDPRSYRDAFIAATALVHDLTVVTRNTVDFEPAGVQLLNPFSG